MARLRLLFDVAGGSILLLYGKSLEFYAVIEPLFANILTLNWLK